jgi:formate-dependent nitrite reductase membrane component NrfD
MPAALPTGAVGVGPTVGYYGRPVLKPPPWTWEVPVYLFAGGLAGGSSALAFAARVAGAPGDLVRTALWISVIGVLASAALLVSDLGRPARFLNMLRVFKWRSPMSVGVWLLTAFGGAAAAALSLQPPDSGAPLAAGSGWVPALGWAALLASALLGVAVATYTGVLLAATVVPAWSANAKPLPVHFGTAGLGSAAALLELLGHAPDALHRVGLLAAAVEAAIWIWTEARGRGPRVRPLRSGPSGALVRMSASLMGPLSLMTRPTGLRSTAAALFLLGALLSRFGWLEAGRASTEDPAAAL